MIAYLKRVDFRYRLLATIFPVVVRKEHDVFAHSLHIRVGLHKFIILQLWVQDRSAGKNLGEVFLSVKEDHTGCDAKSWDAYGVEH